MKHALLEIKSSERAADANFSAVIPDEAAFDVIKEVVPILQKFADVREFMSGEKYPTICWVVQKAYLLTSSLKKTIGSIVSGKEKGNATSQYILQMSRKMLADMNKRWPNQGCDDLSYAISHILHPGLRGFVLLKKNLYQHIGDEMVKEEEPPAPGSGNDEAMILDEEDEEQMMVSQALEVGPVASDKSPLIQEFEAYRRAPQVPIKVDVLQYWKMHAKEFPMLARLVRKYFCIQATSCSSERTFSTGGQIITAKRTKLDPNNVHMLVYLRENLGKVKLPKLIVEDEAEEAVEAMVEKEHPTK